MIPNRHGEGRGVGAWPRSLGTWPAGQQAPRGGGDESPPARAGGSSLLTGGPSRWEDLPPRPSCACYLGPAAAPGQLRARWAPLGARADFPAAAGPEGQRGRGFLSCSLAALCASGRAACRGRKPGCEEPCAPQRSMVNLPRRLPRQNRAAPVPSHSHMAAAKGQSFGPGVCNPGEELLPPPPEVSRGASRPAASDGSPSAQGH